MKIVSLTFALVFSLLAPVVAAPHHVKRSPPAGTKTYAEAYGQLAKKIMAAHPNFDWIVDNFNPTQPEMNRVLAVNVSDHERTDANYKQVASAIYPDFLAVRRRFFPESKALDCWVLVCGLHSKQVRYDAKGAHVIP